MKDIRKTWYMGRFGINFTWRGPENWGRFGGGWNWKIGVQWGSTCILLSLLVCELMFIRRRHNKQDNTQTESVHG